MSNTDLIIMEKRGGVAILTFNRPQALNAINSCLNAELFSLLDQAEKDPETKVIVVTGAGDRAFIAGADIKEMQSMDAIAAREFALEAKKTVDKLYNLKKPVIAAVNGFCLGGGLEYAMACDFRVASANARFALPEISIGIMPGSGGTQRLPRLIGMGQAKEMIYTGEMIDAEKALNLGIINHIFKREELLDETMKIAEKIAAKSAVAVSLIKSSVNRGSEADLNTASIFEIDCFALCFTTEEQKRAMAAFAAKSK
jgi:enoyl-CoA hydratase